MEKEKEAGILEAVEFIFRHPWIFLSSIIFIMSVVFAQLSYVKLSYRAQAIVSFEIISEESASSGGKISQKVNELTTRVVFGESMDEIINEVWPGTIEKRDPQRIAGLRSWLRSRGGIGMEYDQKSNLLTIDFQSSDPALCYKMVQAAINALKRENKKTAMKRLMLGLDFLKEQSAYYKDKIGKIDEEISRIRSELKEGAPRMTEKEKMLISEITGEEGFDIMEKTALQKFAKYDDKLVEFDLQLLELEKKKRSLEEALKSGKIMAEFETRTDFSGDVYINEYSRRIADKQLEIANFRSQGYLPAHPEISKLEKEVVALEELKDKRIKELKGISETEGSEAAEKEAEKNIKNQLASIDFQIETINDKMKLLQEQYRTDSGAAVEEGGAGVETEVAAKAAKLRDLKKEKEVAEGYYAEIRKDLEQAELKSRTEESEAGLTINVVEEPVLPTAPIPFQKTQKVVFGFLVAVFAGALLSYIADSLDNSVRTASELRGLLEIPVLGSVDRISTVRELKMRSFQRKIIVASWVVFALLSRFFVKIFF